MNIEELMLFYINMENREWEAIINSRPLDKINKDDFAHGEFCSAVRRHIIIKQLTQNLSSKHSGNQYWAGLGLYEYQEIEKLFSNNN